MKKLIALVLALVCVVGLVGCGQQEDMQKEQNIEPSNIVENIEWIDGVTFIELAPDAEAKSSGVITITGENAKLAYSITYGRAALTLEFGLIAADGTEYVKEIIGGSEMGYIENIPAGTYHLVVRNSGDYTSLPSYQNGSASYKATGAINYGVE